MKQVILLAGPARQVFALIRLKARLYPGKTIKELKGEASK